MSKENPGTQATKSANPADLNWLHLPGWEALPFPADVHDDTKIQEIKKLVKSYLRGCLKMYNAIEGADYELTRVQFDRKSASPLLYTVSAFLSPFVTEIPEHDHEEDDDIGGGHLIPPEPPPPDDFD